MKRLVALAVAAGMTWLGVVGVGGAAQAVVPGANGRILFTRVICSSDACPCWEIVAADPNGTHETLIAGPYRRSVWDDHFIANWSPDGETVIFMTKQAIWEVNADGPGLHAIWRPPHDRNWDRRRTGVHSGRAIHHLHALLPKAHRVRPVEDPRRR
jgi:hypothetical protein